MHLREPLLGVVLHAEKARLVVEVVLEHEVQVRIEERPVIGHEVEGRLIEQYAVLDRRRPGQHGAPRGLRRMRTGGAARSEEHTSELQSQSNLVCRLLLEKKK